MLSRRKQQCAKQPSSSEQAHAHKQLTIIPIAAMVAPTVSVVAAALDVEVAVPDTCVSLTEQPGCKAKMRLRPG